MCKNWFKPKIDTSAQDFAEAEAVRVRDEETARQSRVAEGLANIASIFDGQTEPLLADRRAAQEDFYLPDLDNQFSDAQEKLKFALSRSGMSTSTLGGKKAADLSDLFARQRGSILSKIEADIANTRTRMGQSRSAFESGVRASGDATAYTNSALSSLTNFTKEQPTLEPLVGLFAGAAEGIGAAKTGAAVNDIRSKANPFGTDYFRRGS